eukprot:4643789-Pyramimonas_sp.AAC.1
MALASVGNCVVPRAMHAILSIAMNLTHWTEMVQLYELMGELMADHRMKAAKLAAWFFCQPSGGSAAQG